MGGGAAEGQSRHGFIRGGHRPLQRFSSIYVNVWSLRSFPGKRSHQHTHRHTHTHRQTHTHTHTQALREVVLRESNSKPSKTQLGLCNTHKLPPQTANEQGKFNRRQWNTFMNVHHCREGHPEMGISLQLGHCLGSQLHRTVNDTIPERKTVH